MYLYRGVVQLFNAVRKQQKVLDEKIKEVGSSELKKEKVEKSMTKDKFLDILKSADSKPEKVKYTDVCCVYYDYIEATDEYLLKISFNLLKNYILDSKFCI